MARKQSFPIPAVGGSSLLVIFAVLCLTVFALLGLSTVQADIRLADASARAVEAYYQANRQANEILARLRLGEEIPDVTVQGNRYCYQCPISDTQSLFVTVLLDGQNYTILQWQSAGTALWLPDDSLPVWDGTF